MNLLRRFVGILALLTLVVVPTTLHAQDTPITVVGSGIAAPLFDALLGASGAAPALTTEVTGTRVGLERFCQNGAQIALTNRGMSDVEAAACVTNTVDYVELLLGDDALAIIGNPQDTFATCLTQSDLALGFAPSAQGQITNWRGLNAANPDLNLSIIVPPNDSATYALMDSLIDGDGLRSDAVAQADSAAIVSAVASTRGALGIVSYSAAVAAGDQVRVLELGTAEGACVAPSLATIETGQYPAAQTLYAYVNDDVITQPALQTALAFLGSADSPAAIEAQGFIAPSEERRAENATAVTNVTLGRTFSIPPVIFNINPGVAGSFTVGGDTGGFDYMQDMTNAFRQVYQGVTPTVDFEGRVAGARRFCNGEVDMITLTAPLTEEQLANCAANGILPLTYDLGSQAVVLLVGAADVNEPLFCLRSEQIGQIWSARPEGAPTNWSAIAEGFPDLPTTLLVPTSFSDSADLMLSAATGMSNPLRPDIVTAGDPLYRAASVAVVDGAMTFMTWREYIRVLENEQFGIRVVRVDNGNGCVLPDINSIRDGSYALTRDVQLVISQRALSRPEVQSFTWFVFSDENFTRLELNDLSGLELSALPDIREALQSEFDAAVAAAATPEPTPDVTATPSS
jgi:phosphate transport system substrate-binding protein